MKISESDYLAGERISNIKHEYRDGHVYAMAGASENHGLITGNILSLFKNQLRQNNSTCDVFSSDMKVKITQAGSHYFYPDVVLFCDKHNNDSDYYKHSPVIIVEVLSQSTRKNDLSTKKLMYFNIPSLQEYVIVEQDLCEINVFRKKQDWQPTVYFLGDTIKFASIGISMSVEDIYYHVNNKNMDIFLSEKR